MEKLEQVYQQDVFVLTPEEKLLEQRYKNGNTILLDINTHSNLIALLEDKLTFDLRTQALNSLKDPFEGKNMKDYHDHLEALYNDVWAISSKMGEMHQSILITDKIEEYKGLTEYIDEKLKMKF